MSCTLFLRGGRILDGSGSAARPADVRIADDVIEAIAPPGEMAPDGARVLDAKGKIITPGFIDTHTHGDPIDDGAFENFLAMGVTTICLGQDGESPRCEDLSAWMNAVDQARPGVNIALFAGHGTLRELAGAGLTPKADVPALERMAQLCERAMRAGCLGITTGLEYEPGCFADVEELVAVSRPVARLGGLAMSHMRSEDDATILSALDEFLAQGRGAQCPVHVSHLKIVYAHGAGRAGVVLGRMEAARREGLRVTADLYPYTASYTTIGIVFPEWAKPPNDYAEVARTRRAELASFLRRKIESRNGPEATLFGTPPWAGRTLAQVAQMLGKPFEDVLVEDIGPDGAGAAYFVMDPAVMERFLVDPHVMICTDGSPTMRHPRSYGSFTRVIREYVVQRPLLPLEQAVHKMTGLSARTLGLDAGTTVAATHTRPPLATPQPQSRPGEIPPRSFVPRGFLAPGYAADLVIFDPATVRDESTFEHPHRLASGMDTVIVNGIVVRENAFPTGMRAGRMLRRPTRE